MRCGFEPSPRVPGGVTRDQTVGEAAVFGLIGTVTLTIGLASLLASALVTTLGP